MLVAKLSLFDDAVQITQFQNDERLPLFSYGTMVPGSYDFGPADHDETVTITHGQMTINGQTWAKGCGRPIQIKKGQIVQVFTKKCVAWKTCFNGYRD